MAGCQPVDEGGAYIQDGDKPLPTPASVVPTDPVVHALISEPFTKGLLPETANVIDVKLDPNRAEKVTLALDGPHRSHLISYSVYPDVETASARFAAIGTRPPARSVERTEAIEPSDPARPSWGESTFEKYLGQHGETTAIVRTSLATMTGRVVCLAQVIVSDEQLPDGQQLAPAVEPARMLLEAGTLHVEALVAAANPGD